MRKWEPSLWEAILGNESFALDLLGEMPEQSIPQQTTLKQANAQRPLEQAHQGQPNTHLHMKPPPPLLEHSIPQQPTLEQPNLEQLRLHRRLRQAPREAMPMHLCSDSEWSSTACLPDQT